MQITEVKVFPVNEEKLKAFVSVVFDGCFMVNDIKVIRGREGLFISMPSRKKKNGEFKDVAHPLNNETRRMMEGQILDEYERILIERGTPSAEIAPRAWAGSTDKRSGSGKPAAGASEDPKQGNGLVPEPARRPPRGEASEVQPVAMAAESEGEGEKKTLKEVEEIHLSDSFWSMN